MKKLFMILLFLFNVFMANPLMACTAFVAVDSDTILVGNNEDWYICPIELTFEQSEKGKFGRVYFYVNYNRTAGMNTQGLMFDFFSTPDSIPEVTISKDKEAYEGDLLKKMLEECATVEQALQLLAKYNLSFLEPFRIQIFIVDKTGDSAIIEGDHIIRKKGKYQVVTNFHQSKVKEENKPCELKQVGCSRYKIAIKMLEDRRNISVDGFRKILQATHQEAWVETIYSYIYDMQKGLIYVYYLHNFEDVATINLNDELKKGNHSYNLSSFATSPPSLQTQSMSAQAITIRDWKDVVGKWEGTMGGLGWWTPITCIYNEDGTGDCFVPEDSQIFDYSDKGHWPMKPELVDGKLRIKNLRSGGITIATLHEEGGKRLLKIISDDGSIRGIFEKASK
jgi:hypothetical protein